MKRLLISAIALAGLGGCATYDYAAGNAPGGYYSGSPRYEYSYPDGYYGGYGGGFAGSYGYGLYGGYGGYGYSPGYYGYYSRPYYVIRPQPRPPHGGHDNDHRPPPGSGGGGHRPPSGGGPRPGRPGDGRPHPPSSGGEHGQRPTLPDRLRPPADRSSSPRAESAPARPVRQSQSRPSSAPAVPRESHFRNRPSRSGR